MGSQRCRLALGLCPGPDTALPSAEQGPRQKVGDSELEADAAGPSTESPHGPDSGTGLPEGAPLASPTPCYEGGGWTDRQQDSELAPALAQAHWNFPCWLPPGFLLVTMCWHLVSLI